MMMDPVGYAPVEDRTMPAVIYGLYLIGLATGITILIGLVLAYAQQGSAGPRMRSHLTFLIRTFWLSIGWFLVGGLLVLFGFPLSFVLIGIPFFLLGWLILAAIGVWFALRLIVGVIYLARDEPYPRPHAMLL